MALFDNDPQKVKITEYLVKEAIITDLVSHDKKGVIGELTQALTQATSLDSGEEFIESLLKREEIGTTGIGKGIAIPHVKSDKVKKISISIGLSKKGVDFAALDEESVYIFFLILAPIDSAGAHLKVLARISRLLSRDKFFRQALREAKNSDEVLKVIEEEDANA